MTIGIGFRYAYSFNDPKDPTIVGGSIRLGYQYMSENYFYTGLDFIVSPSYLEKDVMLMDTSANFKIGVTIPKIGLESSMAIYAIVGSSMMSEFHFDSGINNLTIALNAGLGMKVYANKYIGWFGEVTTAILPQKITDESIFYRDAPILKLDFGFEVRL